MKISKKVIVVIVAAAVVAAAALFYFSGIHKGGKPSTAVPGVVAEKKSEGPGVVLASKPLEAGKADSLAYKDEITVSVPEGLVKQGETLTISSVGVLPDRDENDTLLSAYEIKVGDLHAFDQSLTVEVKYDPSQVSAEDIADHRIVASYWDPESRLWMALPTTVDEPDHLIKYTTRHLSVSVIERLRNYVYESKYFVVLYDKNAIQADPIINDSAWKKIHEKMATNEQPTALSGSAPAADQAAPGNADAVAGGTAGLGGPNAPQSPAAAGAPPAAGQPTAGNGAVAGGTANVSVAPAAKPPSNAAPFYIQDLGSYMDYAYQKYDPAFPGPGASPKAGAANGAPVEPVTDAKLVVKVDSAFLQTVGMGSTNYEKWFGRIHVATETAFTPQGIKLQTAHELFHAIQNRYLDNQEMASRFTKWFVEASAEYAGYMYAWAGQDVTYPPAPEAVDGAYQAYFPKTIETVDGRHEYATAYFLDFLVKKGADFAKMFRFLVTKPNQPGVDVLTPMSDYLKSIGQSDLPALYKEFARKNIFTADSFLSKDDRIPPAAVDQWQLRKANETAPATYAMALPGHYTATLLGLRVEGGGRDLTVAVPQVPPDVEVYVYTLAGNLRSGAAAAGDFGPGTKDQSASVTVGANDALYVLAVNTADLPTGSSDSSISVTVSEDNTSLCPGIVGMASGGLEMTTDTKVETNWYTGEFADQRQPELHFPGEGGTFAWSGNDFEYSDASIHGKGTLSADCKKLIIANFSLNGAVFVTVKDLPCSGGMNNFSCRVFGDLSQHLTDVRYADYYTTEDHWDKGKIVVNKVDYGKSLGVVFNQE